MNTKLGFIGKIVCLGRVAFEKAPQNFYRFGLYGLYANFRQFINEFSVCPKNTLTKTSFRRAFYCPNYENQSQVIDFLKFTTAKCSHIDSKMATFYSSKSQIFEPPVKMARKSLCVVLQHDLREFRWSLYNLYGYPKLFFLKGLGCGGFP